LKVKVVLQYGSVTTIESALPNETSPASSENNFPSNPLARSDRIRTSSAMLSMRCAVWPPPLSAVTSDAARDCFASFSSGRTAVATSAASRNATLVVIGYSTFTRFVFISLS
jgi:hypothetical protein